MHIFVQKKKKCLRRFSRGHICTHLCKELGACIYFVRIIITINFIHRIHICTNTPSISLSSSPWKGTKSMHKYIYKASWCSVALDLLPAGPSQANVRPRKFVLYQGQCWCSALKWGAKDFATVICLSKPDRGQTHLLLPRNGSINSRIWNQFVSISWPKSPV